MEGAIFKEAAAALIEHLSPAVVIYLSIIILAFWLAYRVNKLISTALSQEQTQNEKIALLLRRTDKLMAAACKMPCFKSNSENCIWLQRDDRNGGVLPKEVECPLLKKGVHND